MYKIEKNSKIPLHVQLFNHLKEDIVKNYKTNEKLPSIRKIASMYNLSKNTVESAYSQLVIEGYIDSIPKSGYIVMEHNLVDFSTNFIQKTQKYEKEEKILYDFFPARLEKKSFPIRLWKRLFNKVVNKNLDLGSYCDRQGEEDLRLEIAKYLNQSRAVKCNAEQIIISNGFISSMSLLALMLNSKHNILAMEDPGYHVASKVYENHKYSIDRIPVDKHGIKIGILEKSLAKLVYVTPSHQYPTGVAMPISNRIKLLEWANSNDGLIIEDDYDSELSYTNRPIPSLQGLDNNHRVIYIGTFSKALSPSIRVSYMILPTPLLKIYKNNFSYYDSGVCLMLQKTLKSFMEQGYWDKHIRKIRTQNKKKHNIMKKLLEEKLGDSMQIVSQGGGLAILINPTAPVDLDKLQFLAKKEKIKLYFAQERSGGNWQAIMMGFGGFHEEEIEKAIDAFSIIWFECLNYKT